jgi:hypothetical protein
MRKTVFIAILFYLFAIQPSVGNAQPRHPGQVPQRHSVSFESQHGEAFSVFIDGNLQNKMPQSRVIVGDIGGQTHEVVVVLKRPVEKAAVLRLRAAEPNVVVNVNYDMRLEQLYLFTPAHNRADHMDNELQRSQQDAHRAIAHHKPEPKQKPEEHPAIASEEDVLGMIERLKSMSFDSDRLALGKTMVTATPMTAAQLARLAQAIDFSNTQVEFLKYAYAYCVDKHNYYTAVEVLTFSSDKKKVLDYIATQN